VLLSVVYVALQRIMELVSLLFRTPYSKELEIVVLRHELAILRRQVHRPVRPADRWFLAAASRLLPRSKWSMFLVTPATLVRWRGTQAITLKRRDRLGGLLHHIAADVRPFGGVKSRLRSGRQPL
jgi:hypothetical protein